MADILVGGGQGPSFMSSSLLSGAGEGPWVFEVPDGLVQRLAQLTTLTLVSAFRALAGKEKRLPSHPAGENIPPSAVA